MCLERCTCHSCITCIPSAARCIKEASHHPQPGEVSFRCNLNAKDRPSTTDHPPRLGMSKSLMRQLRFPTKEDAFKSNRAEACHPPRSGWRRGCRRAGPAAAAPGPRASPRCRPRRPRAPRTVQPCMQGRTPHITAHSCPAHRLFSARPALQSSPAHFAQDPLWFRGRSVHGGMPCGLWEPPVLPA